MSLAHEVECVRGVPMLSRLEPAAQKMLCFAAERVVYEAGEVMFRQGDAADAAYLVLEGTAEVLVWTAGGSLVINAVGPMEILGETGMFGDLPRSATVAAKTRLEALRFPRDVFQRTIHGSPEAAMHLSRLLAERLARTTALLAAATV